MKKFYGQKKGKKKTRQKQRPRLGGLPVDVKIRRALLRMDRNIALEFKDTQEQVAFENIQRIALGNQIGRLGENQWQLVRNVLLRNQGKKLR